MKEQYLMEQLASKDLRATLSFLLENIEDNTPYYKDAVLLAHIESDLRRDIIKGVISLEDAKIHEKEIWHKTMNLIDTIKENDNSPNLPIEVDSISGNKIIFNSVSSENLTNKELKIRKELLFNKSLLEASFEVLLKEIEKEGNISNYSESRFQKVARINRIEISIIFVLIIIVSIYFLIDYTVKLTLNLDASIYSNQFVLLIPVLIFLSTIGLISIIEKKITYLDYLNNLKSRSSLLLSRFDAIYYSFVSEDKLESNG